MSSVTLSEMLEPARSGLGRVAPSDLSDAVSRGAIVVGVRDPAQRSRQGGIDVAPDQEIIPVWQGFSSSLTAARHKELGLTGATDRIGGYEAWRAHVEGR